MIDWENTGLADTSQELGLVLFEFGCGEPERARALYGSYQRERVDEFATHGITRRIIDEMVEAVTS